MMFSFGECLLKEVGGSTQIACRGKADKPNRADKMVTYITSSKTDLNEEKLCAICCNDISNCEISRGLRLNKEVLGKKCIIMKT